MCGLCFGVALAALGQTRVCGLRRVALGFHELGRNTQKYQIRKGIDVGFRELRRTSESRLRDWGTED